MNYSGQQLSRNCLGLTVLQDRLIGNMLNIGRL
jgi:hypothetical protein